MPIMLIVDDDPIVQAILVRVATGLGFDVRTAVDGIDALDRLKEAVPDVVLTDLDMPRLGGQGLLERIKSTPELQAVQVIVLTGSTEPIPRDQLQAAGAAMILPKPIDIGNLRRLLSVFLTA